MYSITVMRVHVVCSFPLLIKVKYLLPFDKEVFTYNCVFLWVSAEGHKCTCKFPSLPSCHMQHDSSSKNMISQNTFRTCIYACHALMSHVQLILIPPHFMILGDSFAKSFRADEWVSARTICACIRCQVASWDRRRTEWAALLSSAVCGNRLGSAFLSVGGWCQKTHSKK